MKKIIKKLSQAVQVVLAAPVRLPPKVVRVARYAAVALGILEAVVPDKGQISKKEEEGSSETAD